MTLGGTLCTFFKECIVYILHKFNFPVLLLNVHVMCICISIHPGLSMKWNRGRLTSEDEYKHNTKGYEKSF